MRRFILLALLGSVLLVAPVSAQYDLNGAAALVQSWYRQYLNREPDPSGMATWVSSLQMGNAPQLVLATILGSEEYYAKSGYTPDGFVRTLFLDVVGREPTPQEYSYWMGRIPFESRRDVAYGVLMRYGSGPQTAPYPGAYGAYPRRPFGPYRRY